MPLGHHADDTQEGIVGGPHSGDQDIPRLQRTEEGTGDGVGTVDKLNPDQGVLRAENIGVDLIQFIPAQVVISVAGGAGKISLGHPVLLKRGEHLAGVLLRDCVNAVKLGPQIGLSLGGQGQNLVA